MFLLEIAEANPHKFRLDYAELESRKQFIRDTRAVVKVCMSVCVRVCVCVCVCVDLFLPNLQKISDHLSSDAARSKLDSLKRQVSPRRMPATC